MRANLFIIGMPRSGTTSMAFWLARHPDVLLSRPKEPGYHVTELPMEGRVSTAAAYAACFAGATHERFLLDATPWYFYSAAAIKSIAAIPEAQVIVHLRDPVSQLISLHNHHVLKNIEPEPDLAKALFTPRPPHPVDFRRGLDYLDVGRFGSHLERLFDHVSRDRVHVVETHRMEVRPQEVHLELLSSLGLEPIPLDNYRRLNEARHVRSRRLHAAASRLSGRSAPRLQRAVMTRVAAANTVKQRTEAPLSVRERLADELADDIDLVAKLTDIDVSQWTRD